YEILTGERPFGGEQLSTVVYRIVAEEPTDPHRINGTLTSSINDVLRRALAKKAEDRFPNCSSFVGALEMACAESRGWTTLAAGAAPAMPTSPVEQTVPPAQKNGTPPIQTELKPSAPESVPESRPAQKFNLPPPAQREEHPHRASLALPALMSISVVFALAGVFAW